LTLDAHLIDKWDNSPVSTMRLPETMSFDLPGGMSVMGDALRMRVASPPVALDVIDRMDVRAKDISTMQLSRERPRLAQETPQFGFDHTPVGYAEIDDSGGVITVIADSSSCEASVAVELDDAASVTTTVDAASLASLPNEASLSTKLRGSLDGGADFQVAEILKQRQSTSSVGIWCSMRSRSMAYRSAIRSPPRSARSSSKFRWPRPAIAPPSPVRVTRTMASTSASWARPARTDLVRGIISGTSSTRRC
jgi:hypothetical protein